MVEESDVTKMGLWIDKLNTSHDCCHTPTCRCGEPLTAPVTRVGKNVKPAMCEAKGYENK